MRNRRVALTELELEAVLAVANDADHHATISSVTESDEEAAALLDACETGLDKLRAMLGDRRRARELRK